VNKLYVIGIGYRPFDQRASGIIRRAGIILANDRLLEVFKEYKEFGDVKEKIRIINNVYETMDFIKSSISNRQSSIIVLLASGDPLFFGIGRMAVREFAREEVEILPDLSSIQTAFSRIKEPWSDALLISLHGGPDPKKRRKTEHEITDLPGLLEKHEKIAILTDKENNPSEIAEVLNSRVTRHASLSLFVCERLGYPDERVTEGTPQEISNLSFEHPNVVIIINRNALSATGDEMKEKTDHASRITHHDFRFGLKEDEIEHLKGMITKDEVRAVTIHKLRLPVKGVFWDIGAGSGSISIEAARLCPELEVTAIEKNEEQLTHIRNNLGTFKTGNLQVVKGEAPQVINGLPLPDRVFIGGSGSRLPEIVSLISEKMNTGIVVINAITIETLNSAVRCLEENGFQVDVTELSVSRSKMIKQKMHMKALNPIFIIKGEK
jgi:precorrin-6Y C5,15-methyltransferase (decarboxylating)